MLQLNAEMLELLEADPQKFQQLFLEDKLCLKLSNSVENQRDSERCHLLVQQMLLGLPIEPILKSYPELACWLSQLEPIVNISSEQKKVNVIYQKLLQNILIFTQFDLVMAGDEKLTAINWSITDTIEPSDKLQNSWRTQMGLFLLAQNKQVPLENISIVYYFFNLDRLTTTYQFSYSQSQQDSFKERLQNTLSKLPIYHDANKDLLHTNINQAQLNLQKFASDKLITIAYLETIPEVEI